VQAKTLFNFFHLRSIKKVTTAQSFPPIIGTQPKILILGSSPGVISLQKQQYFAHPRNAFWSIMAELFDIDISQDYEYLVSQCKTLPIIIWDSLKQCEREGSLDSSIDKDSIVANDFESLFNVYPNLNTVYCNGGAAYKWFNLFGKSQFEKQVEVVQLPSTSPAYASMTFEDKLDKWSIIKANI